ncbi:MAG: hypothetical protein ABI665_03530 [Vicinamibacterales bacterium]
MRWTKTLAAFAGALLVAFHGWLLASQFADGRLVEPWLVFRWILAVALIASLVAIRRQGASLLGRKSIAIWVLAALLHGPAIAADFGGALDSPALPEVVATIVLQVVVKTAVLALGLWILVGIFARRERRPLASATASAFAATGTSSASFSPSFSPRPPPRA